MARLALRMNRFGDRINPSPAAKDETAQFMQEVADSNHPKPVWWDQKAGLIHQIWDLVVQSANSIYANY